MSGSRALSNVVPVALIEVSLVAARTSIDRGAKGVRLLCQRQRSLTPLPQSAPNIDDIFHSPAAIIQY